jgi:uncharacterized protein with HEPN domain
MPRDATVPPTPEPEDRLRIEHMLKTARDALVVVGDLTSANLARDMIKTRALVNCFTEIGEAAARLTPAGRTLVGDMPWRQIVGMRNIVVHVYWGVDLGELVKTTRNDLPGLIAGLEAALASWPEPTD